MRNGRSSRRARGSGSPATPRRRPRPGPCCPLAVASRVGSWLIRARPGFSLPTPPPPQLPRPGLRVGTQSPPAQASAPRGSGRLLGYASAGAKGAWHSVL